MGKELKDMTILEKLHWLAFPHQYNNSDNYTDKEMVYNELVELLKNKEIKK